MTNLEKAYQWWVNSAVRLSRLTWDNPSPTQVIACSFIFIAALVVGLSNLLTEGFTWLHIMDVLVVGLLVSYVIRRGASLAAWRFLVCVFVVSCVMMSPLVAVWIWLELAVPNSLPGHILQAGTFLVFVAVFVKNLSWDQRAKVGPGQ
jgi:hypothetical protein